MKKKTKIPKGWVKYDNYEELQTISDNIIREAGYKSRLTFSIFDDWEDDDGPLYAPDLQSILPVYNGKCVFRWEHWGRSKKTKIIGNPIWKDIVIFANKCALNDHIFLEAVELKEEKDEIKYYELWFGS